MTGTVWLLALIGGWAVAFVLAALSLAIGLRSAQRVEHLEVQVTVLLDELAAVNGEVFGLDPDELADPQCYGPRFADFAAVEAELDAHMGRLWRELADDDGEAPR